MAYWQDGRPVGRLHREYQQALSRGQTSRSFEEYSRAPAGSHPDAAPISSSIGGGGASVDLGQARLRSSYQDAVRTGQTSLNFEAWTRQGV